MASAALGQSLDPVRVEIFRSILKGNECTLTEAAASNILPRFDFTREETRAIVGALVAAGEVQLDGNTLNLVDGSCGSGDPVADLLAKPEVQQFIAIMSENGCAMTEAQGEAVFTARGMDKAQVGEIVGPLMQANMASFSAGVLRIDGAYCSAPVAMPGNQPEAAVQASAGPGLDRSGMFGMSRVRQLVDVMAANNCTLNMETPDAFLAEAGIEHGFATFIARKMIADGFASMLDGETMQLPAPYCLSTSSPVAVEDTPEGASVDMAMVASLREIFLANNCRLGESQMDALLPPAGFTKDNIKPVFGFLEANGEMGENGADLVFYNDACSTATAEVAADTATAEVVAAPPAAEMDRSGMFAMSRVRQLVDVMAQNGCTLNMEVADGYLAEAGIEHGFATFIARKMIADGFASMADEQNMVLPAPYCIAAGGAAPVEVAPDNAAGNTVSLAPVDLLLYANLQEIGGCEVARGDLVKFGVGIGLSGQAFKESVLALMDAGLVQGNSAGDTFTVVADNCVPGGQPARLAQVLALRTMFEQNACHPRPEDILAAMTNQGMSNEDFQYILHMWNTFGMVHFVDVNGNKEAVLGGGACPPLPGADPVDPGAHAEVNLAAVATVRDMFAANGCRMTDSQLLDAVTTTDVASADLQILFDYLEVIGEASKEGDTIVLSGDYCPVGDASGSEPPAQAAPMAESGQADTVRARFLSVAAQNGCALDVTAADAALASVGLRMDQAYRIVDELVAAGDASLSNGGALVSLNPALCGADMQPVEPEEQVSEQGAPPAMADTPTTAPAALAGDDPRAAVLAMLAANGCEVTQANAADMIAAAGLDYNSSMQILTRMMASGEAISPDGGQTLQVGAPLCVAAGVEPMTPREAFIDLIRQNNCSITAAEFGSLLPANGLDASTAFGMISELEAEGVISLPATRDVVTLSTEMCR
jgi:hypothetical protein